MSGPVGGAAFRLSAAGTDTIAESGGGILHCVVVNTGASGASVTLHDGSASGPVIAVIAAAAQASLVYDVLLENGLTAVVTNAPDVTIVILPSPEYTP